MCLAAIALDASRRFPLVVAANRDEYFHRPAARMDWWTPDGGTQAILGGRDLSAGGTWMGLTAQGRFGRPLRAAGIQHPAPRLTCTVYRNATSITMTAPYATTLLNGQPALNLLSGDPQTALWFML